MRMILLVIIWSHVEKKERKQEYQELGGGKMVLGRREGEQDVA